MYSYKNFGVYFTYLPRSPLVQICMKFLREGSSSRHNQPCQILPQSNQGF